MIVSKVAVGVGANDNWSGPNSHYVSMRSSEQERRIKQIRVNLYPKMIYRRVTRIGKFVSIVLVVGSDSIRRDDIRGKIQILLICDRYEELSLVDSADLETHQVQVVLRRTQNAYRVIQKVRSTLIAKGTSQTPVDTRLLVHTEEIEGIEEKNPGGSRVRGIVGGLATS